MFIQSVPPAPENPVQQAANAQYHGRILDELIEIGADVARLIHQHVKAQAAPVEPAAAPAPDVVIALATAFECVARAVRRTILLARKVAEPVAPAAQHRMAARRRIVREVEDAIQRTVGDAEAAILHADLIDRLDGPDLDDDIDTRPIADIIADICRDLGLAAMPGTHPWKRRTAADVAALGAVATMVRPTATPAVHAAPPLTPTGGDPLPRAAETCGTPQLRPT